MNEGEIRAIRLDGVVYYTVYIRRIYFIFRGRWRHVLPTMIASYDRAELLMNKNL